MKDNKTPEEIEALKLAWEKDPCWDIEDTQGYEAHSAELKAWRLEYEAAKARIWDERENARREKVMLATGVSALDRDIIDSLPTFGEVSHSVEKQDLYLPAFSTREAISMAELAQEQVRSNLLVAAQLKRIADVLERIDDGDTLAKSVRIWGSG